MEDLSFIWKSVILVVSGTLLLRIAGRKSISQMNIAQTVIMISIGSIIIEPIIEDSVWKTIIAAAIFIGALILMEYSQIKLNFIEKFLMGDSKVVIQDGDLIIKNLKKLRFSVDQLEMRLRQNGINDINNVKYATLEPNGQLGYELKRHAQTVTIGEMEQMFQSFIIKAGMNPEQTKSPLFDEVIQKEHDKHIDEKLK